MLPDVVSVPPVEDVISSAVTFGSSGSSSMTGDNTLRSRRRSPGSRSDWSRHGVGELVAFIHRVGRLGERDTQIRRRGAAVVEEHVELAVPVARHDVRPTVAVHIAHRRPVVDAFANWTGSEKPPAPSPSQTARLLKQEIPTMSTRASPFTSASSGK